MDDIDAETEAAKFYHRMYAPSDPTGYATTEGGRDHAALEPIREFVYEHGLHAARCLEVGSGRGVLQDVVPDYVGVDITEKAGKFLHKPFYCASATSLPFEDSSFDAIWSWDVLEHVPNPERAFEEMRRVIKPRGLLFLAPAWHCRPWAAEGYAVRKYSELVLRGKIVKATIPIRDSLAVRAGAMLPWRLHRLMKFLMSRAPTRFSFRPLVPNYEIYWTADSDAVNSMDPFEAVLWFLSRGDECVNYPSWLRALLIRSGPVIIRRGSNTPLCERKRPE